MIEIEMFKTSFMDEKIEQIRRKSEFPLLSLDFWNFEFVSEFDIRISDFEF